MEILKNCPNCGGVLDDTGRCKYCQTKVYDLTDLNLDLTKGKNIFLMRIKTFEDEEPKVREVYLANFEVQFFPNEIDCFRDANGCLHRAPRRLDSFKVHLDFISY